METLVPIKFAPDTIIVADNRVVIANYSNLDTNLYLMKRDKKTFNDYPSLTYKEKELVMAKLN